MNNIFHTLCVTKSYVRSRISDQILRVGLAIFKDNKQRGVGFIITAGVKQNVRVCGVFGWWTSQCAITSGVRTYQYSSQKHVLVRTSRYKLICSVAMRVACLASKITSFPIDRPMLAAYPPVKALLTDGLNSVSFGPMKQLTLFGVFSGFFDHAAPLPKKGERISKPNN